MFNEFRKDFVENTQAAPADKSVVESFVWSIFTRSIFPLQAMLNDVDDPTEDTPVINSGNPVGQGEIGFNARNLLGGKIEQCTRDAPRVS